MTPREDLVNSAVEFLRNPQVANTPLDKKRAFLEHKNLSPAEIDLAIARLNDPQAFADPYSGTVRGPPPPQAQGYGAIPNPYGAYPPMQQQQQQQPPRRDWRDWFIMATVTTGVGYGLYTLARRYVTPLIAPPTPPQIEQDKAAVDANFDKAFALIEQLSADTAELKAAEEARTQRLDSSLTEVEAVMSELKAALADKEREAQRIKADIAALRESIPTALQGFKSDNERRLADVGQELRSLKMLLGNRVGVQAAGGNLARPAVGGSGSSIPVGGMSGISSSAPPTARPASVSDGESTPKAPATGAVASNGLSADGVAGKRSIPAWQMAAANSAKVEDESSS